MRSLKRQQARPAGTEGTGTLSRGKQLVPDMVNISGTYYRQGYMELLKNIYTVKLMPPAE